MTLSKIIKLSSIILIRNRYRLHIGKRSPNPKTESTKKQVDHNDPQKYHESKKQNKDTPINDIHQEQEATEKEPQTHYELTIEEPKTSSAPWRITGRNLKSLELIILLNVRRKRLKQTSQNYRSLKSSKKER